MYVCTYVPGGEIRMENAVSHEENIWQMAFKIFEIEQKNLVSYFTCSTNKTKHRIKLSSTYAIR